MTDQMTCCDLPKRPQEYLKPRQVRLSPSPAVWPPGGEHDCLLDDLIGVYERSNREYEVGALIAGGFNEQCFSSARCNDQLALFYA